jgi:crotonobetainyl-CoA:carnitine CoA-transferase CaiB-like acyl-CoA transferase
MVESAHVSERGALVDAQVRDGRARMPGPPFRIEGMFGDRLQPAPRKGEHNHAVLCERLGYTDADLVRLHGIGVI